MRFLCQTKDGEVFEASAYINDQSNLVFRKEYTEQLYNYDSVMYAWKYDGDTNSWISITEADIITYLTPLTDMHGRKVKIGDVICYVNIRDTHIICVARVTSSVGPIGIDHIYGIYCSLPLTSIARDSLSTRWTKIDPA